MSKPLGLEYMNKIAISRGGICISKKYKGIYDYLKWKCEEGHIFNQKYAYIKDGAWCPKCNIRYKKESICRYIMEKLFSKKFIKKYPKFLKGLELDGYNEELGIAFEYNGEQHYMLISKYIDEKDLNKIQYRDKLKKDLCEQNNIKLVVIPYWIKLDNIKNFILEQCNILNIDIPNRDIVININNINIFSNTYFKKIKDIIRMNNGTCISKKILCDGKINVKCKNGHINKIRTNIILYKKKIPCSNCAGNIKKTLYDAIKLAKNKGGKFLSNKMDGVFTKYIWECSKGHKWLSTYDNIKSTNCWCPYCNTGSDTSKYDYLNKQEVLQNVNNS